MLICCQLKESHHRDCEIGSSEQQVHLQYLLLLEFSLHVFWLVHCCVQFAVMMWIEIKENSVQSYHLKIIFIPFLATFLSEIIFFYVYVRLSSIITISLCYVFYDLIFFFFWKKKGGVAVSMFCYLNVCNLFVTFLFHY